MNPLEDFSETEIPSADITSVFEYDEISEEAAPSYLEDAENIYAAMF